MINSFRMCFIGHRISLHIKRKKQERLAEEEYIQAETSVIDDIFHSLARLKNIFRKLEC